MKRLILGWLAAGILASPLAAQSAVVTVGTREWRQVTETTNFTWNQVATRCDSFTGVCSGSLGTVSFDGWTWASNADIQQLFTALIGNFFPTSTTNYLAGVPDSPGIANFFAPGNFAPTEIQTVARRIFGFSRTRNASQTSAFLPDVRDFTGLTCGLNFCDQANLGVSVPVGLSAAGTAGVWLYRDAKPVPEPGSLLLLASGLLGLLGMTRRTSKAAAV